MTRKDAAPSSFSKEATQSYRFKSNPARQVSTNFTIPESRLALQSGAGIELDAMQNCKNSPPSLLAAESGEQQQCKSEVTSREAFLSPRRSPRFAPPVPVPSVSSSIARSLSKKCLRSSSRTCLHDGAAENGNAEMPASAFLASSSKLALSSDYVPALRRPPRFASPAPELGAESLNSALDRCLIRSSWSGPAIGESENSGATAKASTLRDSSIKVDPMTPRGALESSESEAAARSGSLGEISTKGLGCANDGSVLKTMCLGSSEVITLSRSQRLSPDQCVIEAETNCKTRSNNSGALRSSPRFQSPLAEDQDVKIKSNLVKESNRTVKQKTKTPSKHCMNTLDDSFLQSSNGNSPIDKGDVGGTCIPPTGLFERVEKKQSPIDIRVTDSSTNKSSVQEKKPTVEAKVSDFPRGRRNKFSFFIGDPICEEEAQQKWRWRYDLKRQNMPCKNESLESDDEDKIVIDVQCHYRQAKVDGFIYDLGDCATIKGEGGKLHVGRILEFFRTTDGEDNFRVRWFYRAEDTVLRDEAPFLDKRLLFYSTIENDNPIDSIIAKVKITQVVPTFGITPRKIPPSDFYFDMEYCLEYSTFRTLPSDSFLQDKISSPPCWVESLPAAATVPSVDHGESCATHKAELTLLDLYSGCGGMSTGLHLGAKVSGVNMLMRWALDYEKSACESLKLNHPETQVRNEAAEDFLLLLKEWERLCKKFALKNIQKTCAIRSKNDDKDQDYCTDAGTPRKEYEVSSLVDICYGDPNKTGKHGLKFKVRWVGYGPEDDTWEPIKGLSKCQEKLQDFVVMGFKSKILPLPGDVDVICGGPPCQGISGYNRFRNYDCPLDDEKNRQIIVFMDIVKFLKPKFVLMENVTDILRFDKASLARYALGRLVHLGYQARMGTIAAGSYGLPQFRLRMFLWGAHPEEMLPQFPLPTHDVIVRYWPPPEFELNTVAYYEGHPRNLEKAAVLRDAISDLPAVASNETREDRPYDKPPETEFQKFIRSPKYEMTGSMLNGSEKIRNLLNDHRPYVLGEDSCLRICAVPKRKGASFRDFPGLIVGADNAVRSDETMQPVLLPSGKPLVPEYVFNLRNGKSKRPFGRLWWDETVPTVVTFPDCRTQAVLHPEQDRVITIRECARLQGFPDYYRFCGTIRERYCQIGNAVAVSVSRALGYSLGMAYQKLNGSRGPNMILPHKFSYSTYTQLVNPNGT